MFYTIYKITNNLDGKYYIGKHQTKDLSDGYMGSGNLVRRAVKKHGKEIFTKEILFVFDSAEEMNAKEKELVVVSEETYNLCPGGEGGFGYINENQTIEQRRHNKLCEKYSQQTKRAMEIANLALREKRKDPVFRENFSQTIKNCRKNRPNHWLGKNHKEESKKKIGLSNKRLIGSKNSQYGTCWITNNVENKKIKKDDLSIWLSLGYKRGRIISLV